MRYDVYDYEALSAIYGIYIYGDRKTVRKVVDFVCHCGLGFYDEVES